MTDTPRNPNLSMASRGKLILVHPDLIRVVERASGMLRNYRIDGKRLDFRVTCGLRTVAEQRVLVSLGKSQTMNSRHLLNKQTGLGHAVDIVALVDGVVTWSPFKPYYTTLAKVFKEAAEIENVPITWGGDWKSLVDGPHFELNRVVYP